MAQWRNYIARVLYFGHAEPDFDTDTDSDTNTDSDSDSDSNGNTEGSVIQDVSFGANQDDWLNVYPSANEVTNMQLARVANWLMTVAHELEGKEPFVSLNMDSVVEWVLLNEFAKNVRTCEKERCSELV